MMMKSIFKKFAVIFLTAALLSAYLPKPAIAAQDQWEPITPAGTAGYAFNTVAVIGDYIFAGTDHGAYRSLDGGATWAQDNTGLGNLNVNTFAIGWVYNFDDSIMTADGATPVYVATDGGVFASTLGGSGWTAMNAGLAAGSVIDLEIDQYAAVAMTDPSIIFAGLSGSTTGAYKSEGGGDWALSLDGEQVVSLTSGSDWGSYAYVFAATASGKVYSADLESMSALEESWTEIFDSSGTSTRDIAMSFAQGTISYLATDNGILKGGDPSDLTLWTPINSGLTTLDTRMVALDYINANMAYAATDDGVFKSLDVDGAEPTWTQINKNLSDLDIVEVKTDPASDTKVYAVGQNGVYKLDLTDAANLPIAEGDTTAPAAALDITVTDTSTSTITITWTAPGDDGNTGTAAAYDVRYSTTTLSAENWATSTQAAGEPAPLLSGTSQSFTLTGLAASTTYYIALQTADEVPNYSTTSPVVSATTDAVDTTAPIIAMVSGVATTTADNTPAVVFSSDEAGTITYSGSCTSTTTAAIAGSNNITFSALPEGTYANCTIRVTDAAANPSNILTITEFTVDTAGPAITAVSATSTAATSTQIIWQTGEPATSQVEYGQTAGYGSSTAADLDLTTSHTALISGLSASTTYHFRVLSADALGNASTSGDFTFTTAAEEEEPEDSGDLESPTAPTGLSATAVSTSQINLSWTAATDNIAVAGYKVLRNGAQIATTSAVSYSDTGLSASTLYAYTVIAYDAADNQSATSTEVQATTQTPPSSGGGGGGGGGTADTQAPAAPKKFAYTASGQTASFTWNNPSDSDLTGVKLVRKTGSVPQNQADGAIVYSGQAQAYADGGLSFDIYYYYALFAYDGVPNYSTPAVLTVLIASSTPDTGNTNPGNNNNNGNGQPGGGSGKKTYANLYGETAAVVEEVAQDEAETIWNHNRKVDLTPAEAAIYDKIMKPNNSALSVQAKFAMAYFIKQGTPTSLRLGAGERAGAIGSYFSAFGRLPQSIGDWKDIIKIANGRWTSERNANAEARAEASFKKVYKRGSNKDNNNDMNAVMVMAYGLRPVLRNLDSEKAALHTFKSLYGGAPNDSHEWDVMRATAYSGAKR